MGLQKFQKNILKATHNLEFLAVLVFPDSSITYVQAGHTCVQVGYTCVRSNNPSTEIDKNRQKSHEVYTFCLKSN